MTRRVRQYCHCKQIWVEEKFMAVQDEFSTAIQGTMSAKVQCAAILDRACGNKGSPKCGQQPLAWPSAVAPVTHLMGVAYRSKPGRLCLRCRESASLSMSAAKSRPTTCQHRVTGCITSGLQPGVQCAKLHEASAAMLQVFHHRPKTLRTSPLGPTSLASSMARSPLPQHTSSARCPDLAPLYLTVVCFHTQCWPKLKRLLSCRCIAAEAL